MCSYTGSICRVTIIMIIIPIDIIIFIMSFIMFFFSCPRWAIFHSTQSGPYCLRRAWYPQQLMSVNLNRHSVYLKIDLWIHQKTGRIQPSSRGQLLELLWVAREKTCLATSASTNHFVCRRRTSAREHKKTRHTNLHIIHTEERIKLMHFNGLTWQPVNGQGGARERTRT